MMTHLVTRLAHLFSQIEKWDSQLRAATLIAKFGTSSAAEIVQMMDWRSSAPSASNAAPAIQPKEGPSEVMLAIMAEKRRKLEDKEKETTGSTDRPSTITVDDNDGESAKKSKRKGDKKEK